MNFRSVHPKASDALFNAIRISYMNIIIGAAPRASDLKFLPVCRNTRIHMQAVTNELVKRGVDKSRISSTFKGDTANPFATPEENRVTVCFVK